MNKAGIRSQVSALLNRNDVTDAQVDTFIDQGLSRIQRTLRIPVMEKMHTVTVSDVTPGAIFLPSDFLSVIHVFSGTTTLEYKDLASFLSYPDAAGSSPKIYTRVQGTLQIKPTPAAGTVVQVLYYGEIPDFTSDDAETPLSIIAPDLMTYAALTFAAVFFVDERKASFEEEYARIYAEVEEQARDLEFRQANLQIQPTHSDY